MLRNGLFRRALACATLWCFFTACYVQRPLTTSLPQPATRIVAQVTDTGSVLMSNAIGAGAIEIEGVVVDATPDSWTLQMVRVDQRGGFSSRWNREVVTFPRIALSNASERLLEKKRSWILAGIMTAIVLGSTLFFTGILGGESNEPITPPPV